ncbi:unnamed protein product [Closterium sp. NIES-54]
MVTITTPGGQRVSICRCTRMGRHLATFTRRPGSSLYTLATKPPQVAKSAQVSTSGQVAPPCSFFLLSHQTLLWLHRLGHPSLPRLRGMHSRLLRAAPHSSSFPPTTAPLQTLHVDVWGPARISGQGRERYFLLVVDDYTRYTTVFPLRSKGEVVDVLIPWIRAVCLQLCERFRQDLPVLRLHSDRGGEFSSDLLRDFCRGEGILQTFTLLDSPQQNWIAERRIGLVMEVARTSMIHAAAPHFLWLFAVRKVRDASVFRVWGSRAFDCDTSADKLSAHAIPCVLLEVLRLGLLSLRVRSLVVLTPAGAKPGGAESEDAGSRGAEPRGAEPGGTKPSGVEPEGAQPLGAEPKGAEPGGAESEGAESGGAEPRGTASFGGSAVVSDPWFESAVASALVAELFGIAAALHLDSAASPVAESESASDCPLSVGGECALGMDVLEDRQEDYECFGATLPHLVSMLIALEGDLDAPDIRTPRSYAEAIEGPYSSQWQTAMDAEMASWKSTGTNVHAVPPPWVNIVDGMWIFRVKLPPGSMPSFKAHYVARGFSQRQGVDFFQTFSPTPKMTNLRVLLHVAAQHDYKLQSLDFSTAFLQGSLHGRSGCAAHLASFGPFLQWHDTMRLTLAALEFAPSTADLLLFLRTDTSLPPFYVLVYVHDLVFATADTEALTLVKSELQKRHTCTDLGELRTYLDMQITWDRA